MSRKVDNAVALYMDGIRDGNPLEPVAKYTGDRYTQHSTGVADGREGFTEFFEVFLKRNPATQSPARLVDCIHGSTCGEVGATLVSSTEGLGHAFPVGQALQLSAQLGAQRDSRLGRLDPQQGVHFKGRSRICITASCDTNSSTGDCTVRVFRNSAFSEFGSWRSEVE